MTDGVVKCGSETKIINNTQKHSCGRESGEHFAQSGSECVMGHKGTFLHE